MCLLCLRSPCKTSPMTSWTSSAWRKQPLTTPFSPLRHRPLSHPHSYHGSHHRRRVFHPSPSLQSPSFSQEAAAAEERRSWFCVLARFDRPSDRHTRSMAHWPVGADVAPLSFPAAWSAGGEKARQHRCVFPGCDKVYSKSSHLKVHERSHTGRRVTVASINTLALFFTKTLSDIDAFY